MAQPTTIFQRLRSMQTEGQSLGDLIAKAADVGDELVRALEKIAAADSLPPGHIAYLSKATIASIAENAVASAYATNGDTPTNGARAA